MECTVVICGLRAIVGFNHFQREYVPYFDLKSFYTWFIVSFRVTDFNKIKNVHKELVSVKVDYSSFYRLNVMKMQILYK